MKVVVIGAGMVGLSVAVALAIRGAEVTVLDKSVIGGGTSASSYAWVNANNKAPQSYFELNRAGMRAHRKLMGSTGNWLEQNGHVEFATSPSHQIELAARVSRLAKDGYGAERISSARARELISSLVVPADCDTIAFFAEEAHCYPSLYLAFLLDQAESLGVSVRPNTTIRSFEAHQDGARVTLEGGHTLPADRVVAAVGRWTNDVTERVGLPPFVLDFSMPGDATVGYLAITEPLPVSLRRLVTSPHLNVRPDGGGRLRLQALDLDSTADPGEVPSIGSTTGREFVSRLRALLEHTDDARLCRLQVARRAMPVDGHSVIGSDPDAPWLYVVATHSGVTLAPLLGDGVASEIFGEELALFEDFRPNRLRGDVHHVVAAPREPGQQ